MELVAMDMKLRGMYIARQLSFKGVTFRIEEIALDKSFVKVYNDSVKMVCFELLGISFVWNMDKGLQACLYVGHVCQQPHILIIKNLQVIDHSKFLRFFIYLCITILLHSQMDWLFWILMVDFDSGHEMPLKIPHEVNFVSCFSG